MRITLVLLTSLLLLTVSKAYGQGEEKPQALKFRFGINAGINMANVSSGESKFSFSPDMKTDFAIGIAANLHWGYRNEASMVGTGWFGLQPEVWYSRQGFALDGEAYSLDYINVPIMARLYVLENLHIEAGPYFGYLTSVSTKSTIIDGTQIKIADLEGSSDAGLGIGAGYEAAFGLTVGARYLLGLSDMAGNLKWKNNVISVSVGWLF